MSASQHSHVPSLLPYLTPPHRAHQALFTHDVLQYILEYAIRPSLEDLRYKGRNYVTSERMKDRQGSLPTWVNPLLVCRCWYRAAQPVIFRCATSKLGKLSFSCPAKFPHPLHHVVRLRLVAFPKKLQDPILAHLRSKSRVPVNSRLRELSLTDVELIPRIWITPLWTQLTLLDLSFASITAVPVQLFLPTAHLRGSPFTPFPNLRHLLIQNAQILPIPAGFLRESAIRLITLRLDHVFGRRDTLQTLLLGTAGPALKQLALKFPETPIGDILAPAFFAKWASLCSGLEWLEIDGTGDHPNILTLHSTGGSVPQIQWLEWLNIPRINEARFIINFPMSILDISGDRLNNRLISRLVHQFLCSSDATSLREVVIPAVPFNTATFDPTWTHSDKITPQPWTCTSLQKLVVTFSLPQYTDNAVSQWFEHCSYAQYSMTSRMSCGFIVTSCPQLVTLDIAFEGKAFDLDTDGGLCFLGRLQRLEQLVWRQTNGLTQSFPMLYFNGIRRNPWPYDQSHEHVLVQQRTVTAPWFDGSGAKELSLPVLRWMSTEPTDDDRKRMWTNIARCRHLYQLDNNVFQTGKQTTQRGRRRSKIGSEWYSMLEAMLTDEKAREGACWDRLQTLTCHVESYDCGDKTSNHKETGAFCNAFIQCYSEELQKVLPHVEIKFCVGQWTMRH